MTIIGRFRQEWEQRGLGEAVRATMAYLTRFANKKFDRRFDKIYKKYFELKYGAGIDVMEQDWDNLILLDAYRYDYFNTHSSINGDLSRKVSRGTTSGEFMRKNFSGNKYHNTVYVTANPHSERLEQDNFFTIKTVLDEWDSNMGTVSPKHVTNAAIKAQKKYPNKRLIIHYMQPHLPHLGSTYQRYNQRFGLTGFRKYADIEGERVAEHKQGNYNLWNLFRRGHISKKEVTKSYLETIEIVEDEVDGLINKLYGKTVISADHGENLGERQILTKRLGHHNETKECRFVPWLELPHNNRKEVIEESPIGFDYLEEEYVESRLEDLGYL